MKDDITFRMDGEKMSKNRYFFGGELKSAMKTKTTRESKENRKSRKTAVDIFLEDQGPYSRKLYGPPPATQESGSGPENMKQKTTKTRPRSQEALLNSSSASNGALAEVSASNSNMWSLSISSEKVRRRSVYLCKNWLIVYWATRSPNWICMSSPSFWWPRSLTCCYLEMPKCLFDMTEPPHCYPLMSINYRLIRFWY